MSNFQFPNPQILSWYNKKLIVGIVILLGLVTLSLGFRPWQAITNRGLLPTPAPSQKQRQRVSNPQKLGFDSLVSEKQPTIVASANPRLPTTLATYEINPAPYQLFSAQAAQALAAQFGFGPGAKASRNGNLYIYRERGRILTLDNQVGTVSFTTNLNQLSAGNTQLSPTQVGQKVEEFLKTVSLNSQFINWAGGEVKSMGLVKGKPKETGLKQELLFYQVTPQITLNNHPLLLPQPLFAQVSLTGKIVGLYTWFINLDGKNPQTKTLKDLKTAQKEVQAGQGLTFAADPNLDRLNLDQVKLAYFAPPSFFVNFKERHFLKIIYIFYDHQGNQVYINAADG